MDLTRTDEVLSKAKLAEICKQECLQIVGSISSIAWRYKPNRNSNRHCTRNSKSITQLKHLYDEHFLYDGESKTVNVRDYKYIAIKKGSVEESYMTSDKQRVIFQTSTTNFPSLPVRGFMLL